MTSGIYRLTFSNGSTYIGKSNNIQRRWKEHADKMQKGKAAINMQAAFRAAGPPKGEVLLECHEDHIALMETYFIRHLHPNLNSADTVKYDTWTEDMLRINMHLLGNSTCEIISMLAKKEKSEEEYKSTNIEQEHALNRAKRVRSKQDIEAAGKELVSSLENTIEKQKQDISEYINEIKLLKRPWWKKLLGM